MFERLDENQQAVIGLIGLVLIVVASYFGLKAAFGAYAPGYELVADFGRSGQNLDTESDVKMRGINVGTVESISLGDDGQSVVKMKIDPDIEVPETAQARVEPISVFGPKFINLVPGEGEGQGPFYEDGEQIAQTLPPLELTDVLGEAAELLDAVDPEDVATVLHTFAEGVDGLGPQIAGGIDAGAVVLDSTIETTEERNQLLADLADLADEMADEGETLLSISRNSSQALPVLTENEDGMAGLLEGTSRLASDLADVLDANRDVLGPSIAGGARLSATTVADLGGMVGFLEFVRTYSTVLDGVIRVPVVGESFVLAAQQFLLGSDPCFALVTIPDCTAPTIDPGPTG